MVFPARNFKTYISLRIFQFALFDCPIPSIPLNSIKLPLNPIKFHWPPIKIPFANHQKAWVSPRDFRRQTEAPRFPHVALQALLRTQQHGRLRSGAAQHLTLLALHHGTKWGTGGWEFDDFHCKSPLKSKLLTEIHFHYGYSWFNHHLVSMTLG